MAFLQRWFGSSPRPGGPAHARVRWLFLRALAFVYLAAFASLFVQMEGLIGSRGILPAAELIEWVRGHAGPERYRLLPTLFWFGSSDALLRSACGAGVVLSLLAFFRIWPSAVFFLLWVAVAVAFRCGLLNIGAEGQLTIAAFATAWAGIVFANVSAWILIPLTCLVAILSGGIWGTIPGVLKARFGSHEVINTIMMNFIAVAVANALTQTYFKDRGDAVLETSLIGVPAHIPRLGQIIPGIPVRIPLNVAFILAVLTCVLVYVFLWRTKWGFELRATGENAFAAQYGGISIRKQVVIGMTVSGALAGMVAINEVLGHRYRYYQGFSPQYGFTGIAVALLGRNHPAGVFLAAVFFGALMRGSLFVDIFTEKVSKDLVLVLQALVILFVAAETLFRRRSGRKTP